MTAPSLPPDASRIPPALRFRVEDVVSLLPRTGDAPSPLALDRLERVLTDGERWLGRAPALAALGHWLIDPAQQPELRRQGCIWLTRFPSLDTARRLSAIALDASAPTVVRDQAAWSLGYRQARAQPAEVAWPDEAVALADETLLRLVDDGALATLKQLGPALRHVDAPGLFQRAAKSPTTFGAALECFGDAALGRAILERLDAVPAEHRLRALRLAAATVGEEGLPLLRARAAEAPPDLQLELLFLAITFGGEGELPAFEAALEGSKFVAPLRERARWHLADANRGVVPTVRGLRVARTTGRLVGEERARRAGAAADDLGVLTRFARHPEAYLYTLWGWMVRNAGDAARARALVTAHPESETLVRDLHLADLASRGRVGALTVAAQSHEAADVGALQLAIHGRPLAALELAATARLHSPELVAARVIACWRAGRPDLSARILAEDVPPSELVSHSELPPFPGPHERWLAEHAPDERPAVTALVRGRDALLALALPAPDGAEPDRASLDGVAAVIRRLGRGLPGSTVYLVGEFGKVILREVIEAAVVEAGARLVSGPFPGTDYYVHGDVALVQTIAQLERQGARRLRRGELRGIP